MQLQNIRRNLRLEMTTSVSASRLNSLRLQYGFVYRTVELINLRFGLILLLQIGFIFIATIGNSAFLWISLTNAHWSMTLLNLAFELDLIFQLFVFTTFSDRIKQVCIAFHLIVLLFNEYFTIVYLLICREGEYMRL